MERKQAMEVAPWGPRCLCSLGACRIIDMFKKIKQKWTKDMKIWTI